VRYALPQPYEEISHTADMGLAARGATPEEALARLVLGLGAMLSGGASAAPAATGPPERVEAAGGADLAQAAVALLRELLFRFATRRDVPVEVEVVALAPGRAVADVSFGRWDPERNAEGADVKAVTYHRARLAPADGGWRAEVLLDV
jgi:SHS2 domain-containing protein